MVDHKEEIAVVFRLSIFIFSYVVLMNVPDSLADSLLLLVFKLFWECLIGY